MNAVYPSAVRTYPIKVDYVTTVDASDVNILQDEMGGVQRTLGIRPQVYAPVGEPAVAYTSVGARLDAHEADLAELQDEINTLSFAASNGWSTPVLAVTQGGITPGVLTLPDINNFTTIAWNTAPIQDVGHMWTPGTSLTCVLGGWYVLELAFTAALDVTTLAAVQNANNALGLIPVPLAFQRVLGNLLINGQVAKTCMVERSWDRDAFPIGHFLNFSVAGPLHQGDVITAQIAQINGNVSGTAVFTATYQRALPGVA